MASTKKPLHNKSGPKTVKKVTAKKVAVKRPRKRRKITLRPAPRPVGIIDHDEVLRKINHVQIQRKDTTFKVALEEALVVDNILRDAGVLFTRYNNGPVASYAVQPGAVIEEGTNSLDSLDELDDEIVEEGHVFN